MNKLLVILLVLTFAITAQEKKNAKEQPKPAVQEQKEEKKWEMKQYYLVLLKRGPVRNQDSASAAAIQKGHMENITRLYNEGKIDIAGPMMNDGDIRGIFVFNVATYEEVLALCNTDPAVKAGRLTMEILPWYAAKGSVLR
ncbi:MAG: hypothetical protein HUU02_09245 [Bacteroidetes bacterium]|nr:hypothetical protein [Bacteroidota bacterium]